MFQDVATVASELPAAAVSAAGSSRLCLLHFLFFIIYIFLLCLCRRHSTFFFLDVPDVTSRDDMVPPSALPPVDPAPPPVALNTGKHLMSAAPAKVRPAFT